LNIRSPLTGLLNAALTQFTPLDIKPTEREGLIDKIREFFKGRAQNLFAETDRPGLPGGISADTFDAAAGAKASWENFPGLVARLQALETFRHDAGFAQIAETFKRVSNILKDAPPGDLDVGRLTHPAEKNLLQNLGKAGASVQEAVQSQAWDKALAAIATLQTPVAELFVAVMVNDPDLEVRKNRQALLRAVRDVVLEVADFSAFQIG
jgi:glycyl-tRNA synthetase beta chain